MATEIKYNGNVIASITRGQTATMACEHKLMTGDIVVEDGTGVHVGPDTPPESVNVWINPNGKPTSVENWDFDMDDGSTETRSVVVIGSDDAVESDRAAIMKLKQADGSWIEVPALVGDKGDKGDRGDTGVYIGTDTPPENSNVWINPNGEPTSTEDWEFDLEDETTETKTVVVLGSDEASANGKLAILKLKQPDGSWLEIPGLKGSKGDKGDKGDRGDRGDPGMSPSHSWNGTVLTVTTASGTSSVDLKGERGERGEQGVQGIQGERGERGFQGERGLQGVMGERGDRGEKGDPGESGVTAPVSGFFTLSVDSEGNLYAHTADNGNAPEFEYDETTGNLYFVTEEG